MFPFCEGTALEYLLPSRKIKWKYLKKFSRRAKFEKELCQILIQPTRIGEQNPIKKKTYKTHKMYIHIRTKCVKSVMNFVEQMFRLALAS